MGSWPSCSMAILLATLSTQATCTPNSAKHAPVTRPTYPVPITQMCISLVPYSEFCPAAPRTMPSARVAVAFQPCRQGCGLPVQGLALGVVIAALETRQIVYSSTSPAALPTRSVPAQHRSNAHDHVLQITVASALRLCCFGI